MNNLPTEFPFEPDESDLVSSSGQISVSEAGVDKVIFSSSVNGCQVACVVGTCLLRTSPTRSIPRDGDVFR